MTNGGIGIFLCVWFFPLLNMYIKCSSLWWNSQRLQEVSLFVGVALQASPPPTLHLFLSAQNPDSCADTDLALAQSFLSQGWQACSAPVCKPGTQMDWGWLKGSGGASPLVLLLVGLMACTMHSPVWSLQKILSPPTFLVWCRLLQLQRTVISTDAELPDELLYGRAGYLYALLYLNTEISPDTVPQSVIKEVRHFSLSSITASVRSGIALLHTSSN